MHAPACRSRSLSHACASDPGHFGDLPLPLSRSRPTFSFLCVTHMVVGTIHVLPRIASRPADIRAALASTVPCCTAYISHQSEPTPLFLRTCSQPEPITEECVERRADDTGAKLFFLATESCQILLTRCSFLLFIGSAVCPASSGARTIDRRIHAWYVQYSTHVRVTCNTLGSVRTCVRRSEAASAWTRDAPSIIQGPRCCLVSVAGVGVVSHQASTDEDGELRHFDCAGGGCSGLVWSLECARAMRLRSNEEGGL